MGKKNILNLLHKHVKRLNKVALLLILCFTLINFSNAQQHLYDSNRTDYWNDTAAYFAAQTSVSLSVVKNILNETPPSPILSVKRKAAFVLLDNVFHLPNPAGMGVVQQYFHDRTKNMLSELDNNKVRKGIFVYKLYNHGYLIQTPDGTFAFDFVRATLSGSNEFALTDSLTKAIVNKCDVLFISHKHKDHADEWVAEEFIRQNKKVITPDNIWFDKPIYKKIIHPVRSIDSSYCLYVNKKLLLKYTAMPGHQTEVLNNIYKITLPSGFTIVHTGDQSRNENDLNWMKVIKGRFNIDLLLPNTWSTYLKNMIEAFNPKIIIPGHENELGHSIDHREAYWLGMNRLKNVQSKVVFMAWGESFFINSNTD